MQTRAMAVLTLAAVALLAAPVQAHSDQDVDYRADKHRDGHDHLDNGLQVDWDGDTLVFKNEKSNESAEMTAEGDLRVNGAIVKLDRRERTLVRDFYGQYVRLEDEAMALGAEGAKIGVAGAALAAKSLAKVARLVREDYDEEDLERELEEEAAKLEARGEELEEQGEALEEMAEELGKAADELRSRVSELKKLKWFKIDEKD